MLQPRQSPSPSPRDTCGCRGTPLPKTKLDDGEASATGKGATPGQRGAAFRATARLSLRALLLNYGAGGHGEAHSWSHTGATSPCSPTRWLKKDVKSTDDLRAIVQRLSAFGPVRSVALCGRQSAVVVFEGTVSACNAVSAFPRRTPDTVFQCSWQQRLMSRDVSEAPCDQTPPARRVSRRLFLTRALGKYNHRERCRVTQTGAVKCVWRPGVRDRHGGVTAWPCWIRRSWPRSGIRRTATVPGARDTPLRSQHGAYPSPRF